VRIGVPRETKDGERRVGLTPEGVSSLTRAGHEVRVEHGAGAAVGFADDAYANAGATLGDAAATWQCECIVKVKELQPPEYGRLARGQIVFGFAQLNRDAALVEAVLAAGVRAIGYELVEDAQGRRPLLAPMSRIAGRLAPLIGARLQGMDEGGAGVLLPGVDAVPGASVVVLGAGDVGREAARIAARLGCRVVVFSRGRERLDALADELAAAGTRVGAFTVAASAQRFAEAVAAADLLIGAVLVPGSLSPKLVPRAMLRTMREGSVLVDVGIDQGGIAETSRMTTLSDPTYVEEGVVHYCVANTPSLVARTATLALTDATLPYVRALAEQGADRALEADAGFAAGVLTWDGALVHPGLAAQRHCNPVRSPWRR
jgi:alanine dehydrogenase